ncbi:glycosyltransferase family 2 protein [Mesorhizobium sp. B2-3-11]|uniref:glycosyltransferase family 2 protein n=1 Tax=Mesorhizobium sp. B2-3-11 TaxID=2589953 RepID=UPI001AEEAF14|nr:glycosyltransferase family 2 protein [Mesorhizobium sp. B2-3-11]
MESLMTTHSLVIPVYRNAENIPSLAAALECLNAKLGGDLEVVFVVDGSPDRSGQLLIELAPKTPYTCKVVFHSRNFGSFAAIRTGMEKASGKYIAAMAADLQEPPELALEFFRILAADRADIAFGKREGRNDPALTRFLSNAFWSTYRAFVLPDMPKGGVDVFACNRAVLDAVLAIEEPNSSLVAQLFWVGFRREFVAYARKPRLHGKSAWNFSRRFRYMMDSVLSFSDLPIMLVLWLGAIGCAISLVMGVVTLIARITGYISQAGYATQIVLTLFLGSLILTVQGILGLYIWRTAENTKRRPLRIISHIVSGGRGS